MPNYPIKVVSVALAEIGYVEKKSNASLDDKKANAGGANYTKYARDLDAIKGFYNTPKQGAAWCDVFVDWCFVQAYGVDAAKKLLCQPNNSLGAGCYYSAQYYKQAGQFHENNPRLGDQIFFEKTGVDHTGIVVKVSSDSLVTVEGNARDGENPQMDGGGVRMKKYSLKDASIYGYGRPAYDKEPEKEEPYSHTDFVKDLQKALGAPVTGKADLLTLGMTMSVSSKINATHAVVKPLQKWLNAIGYSETGKVDGIAGAKFTSAVSHYQQDHDCTPTGALQEWDKTWHSIIWSEV